MTAAAHAADGRRPVQDLAGLVGAKLGNYRLERLLGRGRMGVVYLATDEALLRPTAIKVLSWSVAEARGHDPVQWFLAEARTVARINHPRVVQIYGAARQGDLCYLAMEYVAGTSAEAMVAAGSAVAPALATGILVQVASALDAAHRSGVVHRDVKPANLLVGADGVTKLGDFGMALGPAEVRTGNAHVRVGTPYYTAPEIWRGEPATASSDLYSLGATYFHLLTGRPPFTAADAAALEQAHLRAAPPDPRDLAAGVPAPCAELVRRALAKSPRDRHASAQALMSDARRALRDAAAHARLPASGPLADVLGFASAPFAEGESAPPGGFPPLDGEGVARHVRAAIEAALAAGAPPIVVTPDALRIVALRSEGALDRVDCMAENMLLLAAAERRRTLTSWHAWTAPDRERWSRTGGLAHLPRRPAAWPPPAVADVIDACRRAAGLPPWPRRAACTNGAVP